MLARMTRGVAVALVLPLPTACSRGGSRTATASVKPIGIYNPHPLVMIASKIVPCPHGTRAYSRLRYVFVGHSPFRGVLAHMNFSGFISAPGRPGLPANQTVSLTC